MKKEKILAFLVSLLLVIFGVVLIIWPEQSLSFIAKGLSFLAIIAGIVLLAAYLFAGGARQYSNWKLMSGVVLILAGMFLIPGLTVAFSVIPFILGVMVVCSGIAKLLHGLEYRKAGYNTWWISVIIAIAAIALGAVAVIYPFKTAALAIRAVGLILILDNFANVFDTVYIGYKLRKDGYAVVGDTDGDIIDVIQK